MDRLQRALTDGLVQDHPTLMLRPPGDPALTHLFTEPPRVWQPFLPFRETLARAGSVPLDLPEGAAQVVVSLTRSRPASQALVARGWACLAEGGRLIVTGQKTDGVGALLKALRPVLRPIDVLAKAHGKLAVFERTGSMPDLLAEWLSADSPSPNAAGFLTRPGVFSADDVDPGSRLLAEHLPALSGTVADLGAGWGWLAHAALTACPAMTRMDLVEAEGTALSLARENVTDPRTRFHWADATRWTPEEPLDWVISNPPFHTGRSADPGLGQAFLRSAARVLGPRGQALIVANRQLPYEATLAESFARSDVVRETGVYKLFHLSHPKRPKRA